MGFWMVNSIPNFFFWFYGEKWSSIIHTKICQPKKEWTKVKACRMLANHKSKHKCLLMMMPFEEKWEEMTRWVHIQDFDFLAMKPNASYYSISLGSTSTLTKQLIDLFSSRTILFSEIWNFHKLFVSYNNNLL